LTPPPSVCGFPNLAESHADHDRDSQINDVSAIDKLPELSPLLLFMVGRIADATQRKVGRARCFYVKTGSEVNIYFG
jgi:hypothetical protein